MSVSERQTYLAEWIVRDKGAVVWCSLFAFRGETSSPQNVRWTITTDCTGAPTDLLCVVNLVYAVLSWIPNASFDDLNGRVCHTPEELVENYLPHLAERFAARSFNKMFESGILDYDGKLNF